MSLYAVPERALLGITSMCGNGSKREHVRARVRRGGRTRCLWPRTPGPWSRQRPGVSQIGISGSGLFRSWEYLVLQPNGLARCCTSWTSQRIRASCPGAVACRSGRAARVRLRGLLGCSWGVAQPASGQTPCGEPGGHPRGLAQVASGACHDQVGLDGQATSGMRVPVVCVAGRASAAHEREPLHLAPAGTSRRCRSLLPGREVAYRVDLAGEPGSRMADEQPRHHDGSGRDDGRVLASPLADRLG